MLLQFNVALAAEVPGAPESYSETPFAVSLNGNAMPAALLLVRPDGRVLARAIDLRRWRLRVGEGETITHGDDRYVLLDAIPGLSWRIEPGTQTLVIDTSVTSLESTVLGRDGHQGQPPAPPVGGFLNYDLSAQSADRQTSAGGLFEGVAFGRWGSLSTSALARSAGGGLGQSEVVRLNSTWILDRPADVATWRLGDTISRAGSWSQPVRLGGLQYATNFSTQPGFITFPLPSLAGEAALPSTVDVYVNDALRMRRDVLAGPFSIPDLPVVTGMGEARVVVRDLLGREQTIVAPFYASPSLLQPGLRDFSYEIGAIRSNYGTASADYGRWVAIATERRGLTNSLTAELHAELSADRRAAGIGGAWLLPVAGVLSASVAGSSSERGSGAIVTTGFQRQGKRLSFGGNVSAADKRFMPLGSSTEPAAPMRQVQSYASFGTSYGSFGVSYVRLDLRDRQDVEIASANWGLSLGRHGYLALSLLRDLNGRETRASLSFIRALGNRTSMSATTTVAGPSQDTHVQVQRNLPVGTGTGYRLAASKGDVSRADGTLLMQNDYGTYGVDVSTSGGDSSYRASMAGGFAAIGSNVFATRTISESFSVVSVPGFADVRVYAANQLVGRTGSDGTLLVPRLLPYQANELRIEQADLPMDATVESLNLDVVPYYRSGVLTKFPVRRSRGGLITVLLDDGQAVPPGAVARVSGNEMEYPAGERGEVYLTDLAKENTVQVSWGGDRCTIEVAFPETTDPLPNLGTFVCHGLKR